MGTERTGSEGYGTLIDRAYLSLREAGGQLSENELAARVFGAGGGGALWSRLLSRVLSQDPRFTHLPSGHWAIGPPRSSDPSVRGVCGPLDGLVAPEHLRPRCPQHFPGGPAERGPPDERRLWPGRFVTREPG